MTHVHAPRQPGWQKRLVYLVDEELSAPFSWSKNNCGDLMAAAVLACHGPNHPVLEELIHDSVPDKVKEQVAAKGGLDGILGEYFETCAPFHAQDGDIATVGVDELSRAGVVVMDGQLIGKTANGRSYRLPLTKAKNIYRV